MDAAASVDTSPGRDEFLEGHATVIGPIPFGGPPFCYYEATLHDIQIRAHVGGALDQFDVEFDYVEVASSCLFPPLPPNRHMFRLADSVERPDGTVEVQLVQSAGMPILNAEWLGRREADGSYRGDLIVRRSEGSSLDWTTGYIINLSRSPR